MRWNPFAIFFLGAWLVFSPLTYDYHNVALLRSDWVSGFLICLIAILHFISSRRWQNWTLCCIGIWLLFAPLLFWTTSPAVYASDTLVGLLLIVFSVGFPYEKSPPGPGIPKGWSYNPSIWAHRIPIIVLGLVGFFIARAMSAYQLGHVGTIWDPFFGEGTKKVLTSEVAKAFPISDAGLGAVTYLLESLSGVIGDTRRWRTMPWMVFLFFVLVVPAGMVGIVLIMLQPAVVGAWCTLCLITATLTLITLPPAVDEVFATAQFLREKKRERKSLWKMFWLGDQMEGHENDRPEKTYSLLTLVREGAHGIGFTPALLITTLIGLWTVLSPLVFGLEGRAANSDYIVGTLIITFSVVASAEPVRALRFLNMAFGVWVLLTPFIFDTFSILPQATHIISGVAVIGLSVMKGKIKERYGIWDKFIV